MQTKKRLPISAIADPSLRTRLENRRASQRFAFLIVGLVSLMALSALAGFLLTSRDQAELNDMRHMNRSLRDFQQALVDAETGVRGFVLTGQPEYLEPYSSGLHTIRFAAPELMAEVDRFATSLPVSHGDAAPMSHTLETVRGVWSSAIALAGGHDLQAAQDLLVAQHGKALMDSLRADIGGFLAMRDVRAQATERHITAEENWALLLNLFGAVSAIAALIFAFDRSIRAAWRRETAIKDHTVARKQVELLFVMAEMLQSATDREDANEVLRATGTQLLPGLSGALYVFNNSRDRLDLSTTWSGDGSTSEPADIADHLTPASCWALKRGKPHRNTAIAGALRCSHVGHSGVSLEIPMAARGELYGLLALSTDGTDAEERLTEIQPIATALADAMSLALSSITLRERLRNQALRDPLTGLYNRRFLEEMLERFSQDAERRRAPLSAIMIDLDHFKMLNDQFGHATGDAVLRQVANTVMATLRGSDVACRYGGEELAILLPDCAMEGALAKAEVIREAIAGLSGDGRAPPVSASLGVASVPDTSGRAGDLLQAADAALYTAKQQGRNRVVAAPLRQSAPKLVVAE